MSEVQQVLDLTQELERTRMLAHVLLKHVGQPAICKGCGAEIYWVRHLNGKNVPYDPDGLNHFGSCVRADQFRKKKENENAGNNPH